MGRSLQIFIEKRLEEATLIDCLNNILSFSVESLDIPIEEAEYFIQLQDFSVGFHSGLNISWRDDKALDIDENALTLLIAKTFNTKVLFESGVEKVKWCMVDENGRKYEVSILEMEDGICINRINRQAM
ncbi:MAG: hypothetical protein AB7S75_11590 [Desulfococcaceae bacterium]